MGLEPSLAPPHSEGDLRPPMTPKFSFGFRPISCVVAFVTLGCVGKETGDEGRETDAPPSEIVENEDPEPETPAPSNEPEPVDYAGPRGVGSEPAGELDQCFATHWSGPDQPRLEASCIQQFDADGVSTYFCSCDLDVCPLYSPADGKGDAPLPPEGVLSPCLLESDGSDCRGSLEATCGLPAGESGFCERSYAKLTATHDGQVTPETATITCFQQTDQSHACVCPDADELVASEKTDCTEALLTACQAPCENELGNCQPRDTGFECSCAVGIGGFVDQVGICEHALHWWCAPNCENEYGACYWDPNGGEEIACLCEGDAEVRWLPTDPDVEGDECRTPLAEQCGGE